MVDQVVKDGRSPAEEWRPVASFGGPYVVSNLGRVRNVATDRVLTGDTDAQGYQRVSLSRNGRIFRHKVHRLVCEAFWGAPKTGEEVGHLNANPSDNRAENLRWMTRSQNARQRVADGNQPHNLPRLSGERHPANKFTDKQVATIRADKAGGMSFRRIAEKHGISLAHAHRIVSMEDRND